MRSTPSLKLYLLTLATSCFISTSHADLISYDLSILDNTTDGAPFNTMGTYPDTYAGGMIVMDPSDDAGRMDQMLYLGFGDTASNGDRRKIQRNTGNLYTKAYSVGFTGSDVLSTNDHSDSHCQFKNSGTVYYNPVDTIFWIGRTKDDESGNDTAFNDMAYGFKVIDNLDGIASAGDVLELVGIVYSTGTDSVFGKTADELTDVVIPSPPPPSEFIRYDLSLLDNTTDGAPFNTAVTFPDAYAGGLILKDPSDDTGRMDQTYSVSFGDSVSNGDNRKIQVLTGSLYFKANNKGYTGSDVLSTTDYPDTYSWFKNSGTVYYNPVDTIFWIGRTNDDESGNQTSFNDMAYGFKVIDNNNGIADAGDVLELVGIIYSTGTNSVFGQTADELTDMAFGLYERVTQLEEQVGALPAATLEDGIKRAVLELALERAGYALDVFLDTEAQSLIDDVEDALAQSAANFAQRNPAADHIAVLMPLLTETNNPYLDAMVLETSNELATTDVLWPRATAGNPTFSGLNYSYGVRGAPELARTYFWLFAHEQSPMRYDPELLKRILRRAHAYVDVINLDPAADTEAPVWIDQFSVEMAFSVLFEIHELHPGLLLPSEQLIWEQRVAGSNPVAPTKIKPFSQARRVFLSMGGRIRKEPRRGDAA